MIWRRRLIALVWIVFVLAVGALVLAWIVRSVEASLAFFPTPGEDLTPASYGAPFTSLSVTTNDGERLTVWQLTHDSPRARIVYFHGNGGNLSLWADILVAIAKRGFDVVAFDYRGYGTSTGKPTEQGLYRDTEAILALVHDRLRRPDLPVIYWGRSLGATMAAYAASLREPDGLILEAAFPSMRAVVRSNPILWALSWFSSYQFPTARFLAHVRAPILLIHGDRDSVIPHALGQQLFEAIDGEKRFVTIPGGDHNDPEPAAPDIYWRAVDELVATSSATRRQ